MIATEVGAGTHVQIVVLRGIENGIDGRFLGQTDRAWGQSVDAIGVVRRVDLRHGHGNALDREVADGKLHRGVGLQAHSLLITVQVQARHLTALVGLAGLFLDNRGHGSHLIGSEAQALGFGFALIGPEVVVIVKHAVEHLLGCDVPVELVGVGHQQAGDGLRSLAILSAQGTILQRFAHAVGAIHEGIAPALGPLVEGAHVIEGETHSALRTVLDVTGCGKGRHALGDAESPFVVLHLCSHEREHRSHTLAVVHLYVSLHTVGNRLDGTALAHLDQALGRGTGKHVGCGTGHHDNHYCGNDADNPFLFCCHIHVLM